MGTSNGQIQSHWTTVTGPRVVVCLDLHNSMADRKARDPLPRSRKFLEHNDVLYECFEDWRNTPEGAESEIDLVDFVGDAGLVTFRANSGEAALTFACEVIERSRSGGCLTAVGVDVGEVAVIDLAKSDGGVKARHAVGFPVDRAVRLSWIARPGEILSTTSVTSALNDSTQFEMGPTMDPVGVSLDKWPAEQLAVCGEVLVHSVRPRGDAGHPSGPPGNALRLADYFRRLQLNALDFVSQARRHWASLKDDFRRPASWNRREGLDRMVEFLEAARNIDEGQIPELAGFRTADDPLTSFSEALDDVLVSLRELSSRHHDVTLADVEATGLHDRLERVAEDLVLYSRAGLRRLELQT